ncbi:hypothetical protein, partial [Streptomyces sp. wa1071]
MTENKALKKAIRKRMAETGEAYNTARRNVLDSHRSAVSVSTGKTGTAHTHLAVKSPYAGVTFDAAKAFGPKLDMTKLLGPKLDMTKLLGPKLDM